MDAVSELRALLEADPQLAEVIAEELRTLGYVVEPPPIPFVAIGAGERAPWADESLTCPVCGAGPLSLQESTGTGSIKLRYITHCGKSWMRGDIDL